MVLFANRRAELAAAKDVVETYLADPLRLRLKHRATMLAPTTEGLGGVHRPCAGDPVAVHVTDRLLVLAAW